VNQSSKTSAPDPSAGEDHPSEGAGRVQSVDRALDLLDQLCAAPESLTASELSRRAGLPYASTHRLLGALASRGYVRADEHKRYSLGPQLVTAGARLTSMIGTWLRPHLTQLMEYCGETVNVARLDDTHILYIAQVQSRQRLRMFTEPGNRVLPHATAVGKVLLASRPAGEVEDILRRGGMPLLTRNTITDIPTYLRELEQVLAQGFAVDNEEGELGVRCVAVPLRGVGDVPLAMSVSGPAARLAPAVQARLVPQLLMVAGEIAVSFAPKGR
jgi:IclR family acetate operon transcriptional repressor